MTGRSIFEGVSDRIGKCYVLSYKYIDKNGWGKKDIFLVHGWVSDPRRENTINHAWVEIGDEVFDPVMDQTMSKQVYYRLYDAKVDKKYDPVQTAKEAANSGTYGPWHNIDMSKVNIPATRAGMSIEEIERDS